MKSLVLSALVLMLVAGCVRRTPPGSNDFYGGGMSSNGAAANGSVLDVGPSSDGQQPAWVSEPQPVQPDAPSPSRHEPSVTETPAPQAPAAPSAGGATHVVAAGDTLYSLARRYYGDGKHWQRIVDANPGVSPQTLRIGQTLVIP